MAPYGIAGQKTVQVVVTHYPQTTLEKSSAAFSVAEVETSLAIFATPQNLTGQPGILNCGVQSCTANSTGNAAPVGSTVVMFAMAGGLWSNTVQDGSISILGQLFDPSQVSLTIGGQRVAYPYVGTAPYQVWGFSRSTPLSPPASVRGRNR